MPEPLVMKFGTYIMAPELTSTMYFINPSLQSVCMCIPPSVARQQLGKHIPVATNALNNRRIVECIVFCAVSVISKGESVGLFVYPPVAATAH
jgi:hypothetical protein